MKRVRCPKCDHFIQFDETKYADGQSLVFVCDNCQKQFGIRIGVSKASFNFIKSGRPKIKSGSATSIFFLIYFWLHWVFVAVCGLSLVIVHELFLFWSTGLVILPQVGSFQTRNGTHVPCIGRWILNYGTTQFCHFLSFVAF